MCGLIAGFGNDENSFTLQELQPALLQMRARGPDAEGVWHDKGVAMGHRRLAILDLDARAHQPMISECARYVIVYNGEIYNFRELRAELVTQGVEFRTTSDTEVVLKLFAVHGEAMLPRLRGMFAFAIWDRTAKRGFVARDPYGIKPLYYTHTSKGVLLASQVKALLATGKVSRAPCARGQASFWLLGSVSEPCTWYRDIEALPAGHCAWIDNGKLQTPHSWWDITSAWRDPPTVTIPAAEIGERVRTALRASVSAHLVADVPVGVFLSGGIDSGALAGLMLEAGAKNLQGVTIAFNEFSGQHEDESPVAARLAAYYGIAHHVRVVTRAEFHADLPRILQAMDQPSIDGINTWYASKAVAELGLKVVVSGVGGDELFQGYSSFKSLPRLVSTWRPLSRLPGAMAAARAVAGLQARRTENSRWKHMPEWSRSMAGAWWLRRGLFSPGDLPGLMDNDLAAQALYDFSADSWVSTMSGGLPTDLSLALGQIESTTYLRNQLLRDSDWASMDHSVELRTPLVDAWLLRDLQPVMSSLRHYPNKSLLALAPAKALPKDIAERRKTGFGIPVARWLQEEMAANTPASGSRDWARRLVRSFDQDNVP